MLVSWNELPKQGSAYSRKSCIRVRIGSYNDELYMGEYGDSSEKRAIVIKNSSLNDFNINYFCDFNFQIEGTKFERIASFID